MKKPLPLYLFLCLAALAGLPGCHKNTASIDGPDGQWRWVRTDWTFTIDSGTVYSPPLTVVLLTLNPNSTFSLTKDGATVASGTYQLSAPCPSGNCIPVITFQNQYPQEATQGDYRIAGSYELFRHNNTLILTADGPLSPAGTSSIQYYVSN
jgi:hypothetical protein